MATFVPSNTLKGLLVDENGDPYTAGTPGTWGAFEPSSSAMVILVDANGDPYVAGGGSGDGSVTSVSAGNLSPLFTSNVANPTTTPAITFSLSNAAANTVLGNATGSSAAASYGQIVAGQIASDAVTTAKIIDGAVTEAKQTLADNTTNNVSTSKHGYVPKATGSTTTFLNANGAYSTPAGGGLILVEKKTFTADATTYTFSGLNGNTDGVYQFIFKIVNNAGSTAFYTLKPNNVTTNQSWRSLTTNATAAATSTQSLLYVGAADPSTVGGGECILHAAQSVNSVTENRLLRGSYYYTLSSVITITSFFGIWAEASTNITSIVFLSDQTNGLGNGSEICLYKFAQS